MFLKKVLIKLKRMSFKHFPEVMRWDRCVMVVELSYVSHIIFVPSS